MENKRACAVMVSSRLVKAPFGTQTARLVVTTKEFRNKRSSEICLRLVVFSKLNYQRQECIISASGSELLQYAQTFCGEKPFVQAWQNVTRKKKHKKNKQFICILVNFPAEHGDSQARQTLCSCLKTMGFVGQPAHLRDTREYILSHYNCPQPCQRQGREI